MITQTVETKPTIDPQLLAKLKVLIANHAMAKRQMEQAKEAYDVTRKDIQIPYELSGEKELDIDGTKIVWVEPEGSEYIDEKSLLRQGVTMAQIQAAKKRRDRPSPYLRVTLAKGMSR
jgi:hypothetical protein